MTTVIPQDRLSQRQPPKGAADPCGAEAAAEARELPLQPYLEDTAAEAHADGIVCYIGTRFTPLAEADTDLFVPGGYFDIRAKSQLFSIPCRCITDWLLEDEKVYPLHAPSRDDYREFSDCVERFRARIGAGRLVKILRGPVAQPWLVVIFVNRGAKADADLSEANLQQFEQSASRLAGKLLTWRKKQKTETATDEERTRRLRTQRMLEIKRVPPDPTQDFEQYVRDSLAEIVDTVRPPHTLELVGNVHVFCDGDYAKRQSEVTRAADRAGNSTLSDTLIDHLIEIPTHEVYSPPQDLWLYGVCQTGIWRPDIIEHYRKVPLAGFRPVPAGVGKGECPCFLRHAAFRDDTHYFESIQQARILESAEHPAVAELFSAIGCPEACNLVIPLVDTEAEVSLGVINIESTKAGVRLDPQRIWLAQHLAGRLAAAIREMRLRAVQRFIHERRHRVLGAGPRDDHIKKVLNETCGKLGQFFQDWVELYEPVGGREAGRVPLGSSKPGGRSLVSEHPELQALLRACAGMRELVCIDDQGSASVVRLGPIPYLRAGMRIAEIDENTDIEIVPISEAVGAEGVSSELDSLRAVAAAAAAPGLGRNLLLIPLRLGYDAFMPVRERADSFCAGVLVLRCRRRWTDLLRLPGAGRMLQPIRDLTDLLALVQRARTQVIGMTTGALRHELPDSLLQGVRNTVTNVFPRSVPGNRWAANYIQLATNYLHAMFQAYVAPDELKPQVLTIEQSDLDNVKAATIAIVHAQWAPNQDYHDTPVTVSDHLGPLWLAMRNWYSNAWKAAAEKDPKAMARAITASAGSRRLIEVRNVLSPEAKTSLLAELRAHPQGRPGRGRHIARALVERYYTNLEVGRSTEQEVAETSTYVVWVQLKQTNPH